ncbi:uncharacterized protein LOC124435195 [Xenia sp. Carnegie-2017]|uniref:uncharacterized protein LOC124435195 n=1 Tax=Xenia sp. Carnegie-2017 TaxID=2897299 RepID=UPI001F046977|nr:uncharacterized protein LOC124435195 [Xenia sp. Carnegie-2017]
MSVLTSSQYGKLPSFDLKKNASFFNLQKYELPVIGTLVHDYIVPGFKYRVRLMNTNEQLFGGKAKKLESIGKGYGRRLTFESEDILENNNFFWSDSHEAGFAFLPEILSVGDIFQALDSHGDEVGSIFLTQVSEPQKITGVSIDQAVEVHATATLSGNLTLLSQMDKNIKLNGQVVITANRNLCSFEFLEKEIYASHGALRFIKH